MCTVLMVVMATVVVRKETRTKQEGGWEWERHGSVAGQDDIHVSRHMCAYLRAHIHT